METIARHRVAARRLLWCVTVLTLGGCTRWATTTQPHAVSTQVRASGTQRSEGLIQRPLYDEIVERIEAMYYRPIRLDTSKAPDVRALMAQLDSHSAYIPPEELDWFQKTASGRFGGIGVQIGIRNGQLTVLSPLLDTPAWRAGVCPGDVIASINGYPTKGMTLHEAVARLTGPPGSTVSFTVQREGRSGALQFQVRRSRIDVQSVMGDRRKSDFRWDYLIDRELRVGYVRVTMFTGRTARELKHVLAGLAAEKIRALILDLRFNPGGVLNGAIDVADLFLDGGLIVAVQGRAGRPRRYLAGHRRGIPRLPLVVLVNDYSASSSEIVAAALQDHRCARLVGQRTYGKGSIQTFIRLRRGRAGLKITTALFYRANGQSFHRTPEAELWGLAPDVAVELNREQERRLLEDRQRRDRLDPGAGVQPERQRWDPQLARALDILRAEVRQSASVPGR